MGILEILAVGFLNEFGNLGFVDSADGLAFDGIDDAARKLARARVLGVEEDHTQQLVCPAPGHAAARHTHRALADVHFVDSDLGAHEQFLLLPEELERLHAVRYAARGVHVDVGDHVFDALLADRPVGVGHLEVGDRRVVQHLFAAQVLAGQLYVLGLAPNRVEGFVLVQIQTLEAAEPCGKEPEALEGVLLPLERVDQLGHELYHARLPREHAGVREDADRQRDLHDALAREQIGAHLLEHLLHHTPLQLDQLFVEEDHVALLVARVLPLLLLDLLRLLLSVVLLVKDGHPFAAASLLLGDVGGQLLQLNFHYLILVWLVVLILRTLNLQCVREQ
mmetsp:Transcript_12270/g.26732  ORF Transcript_12270/g.26732 Transcript_12270/m.26732 type:complete len:336 (-) Transcript_12270:1763-2770(-)